LIDEYQNCCLAQQKPINTPSNTASTKARKNEFYNFVDLVLGSVNSKGVNHSQESSSVGRSDDLNKTGKVPEGVLNQSAES